MELFERYPSEHATIKKAMRISNSTYHRLMKEINTNNCGARSRKRVERSKKKLDLIERTLVRQMVQPPAKPLTLNEI